MQVCYKNRLFRLVLYFIVVPGLVVKCSWFEPENLAIESAGFCDLVVEGLCEDAWTGSTRLYRPEIPAYKTMSWFDLGYYMYFHSRETPGLMVHFNRNLKLDEKRILKQSLHCNLTLIQGVHSIKVHMEGSRLENGYFWCFDYLGSHLVSLRRKIGPGQEKVKPERNFFPIGMLIEMSSDLPAIQGRYEATVDVDWIVK